MKRVRKVLNGTDPDEGGVVFKEAARYSGFLTGEQEAKMLLEAVKLRQEFKGTDAEWTKLVRKATGQDDEPEPPKEEKPRDQRQITGDLGTDE